MSYQPGIPSGTVDLDQDYINIRNNFTQLDNQFGVDHIPFSNNSGTPPTGVNGYHTSVHLNPISTTATNPTTNYPPAVPPTTIGFGQIFGVQVNDGFGPDQTFYYLSGQGRLTQMTRNFQPVTTGNSNQNGSTFLPGGIVLQWGFATVAINTTTSILFVTNNKDFPTACFNVQITGLRTNNGGDGVFLSQGSVSPTGFTVRNGSGSITQIYWTALGI